MLFIWVIQWNGCLFLFKYLFLWFLNILPMLKCVLVVKLCSRLNESIAVMEFYKSCAQLLYASYGMSTPKVNVIICLNRLFTKLMQRWEKRQMTWIRRHDCWDRTSNKCHNSQKFARVVAQRRAYWHVQFETWLYQKNWRRALWFYLCEYHEKYPVSNLNNAMRIFALRLVCTHH